MKKFLAVFLFLPNLAHAQASNNTTITWLQPAPDSITASSYIYKYHLSQNDPGKVFPTLVECGGLTSPFTCHVVFPLMTQGPFTMWITAGNSVGVSEKSVAFAGVYQTQRPVAPIQPRYLDPIPVPAIIKNELPLPPTGARIPSSEPGSPKPAEAPYEANKAGKASAPAKGKK